MQKHFGNTAFIKNILILFFLYICNISFAQQENAFYPNFTTVPGLPSKMVYSVFKDSKGFMWFGTENGLYRYDGYEYKAYYNDPHDSTSISGNLISQVLFEDKEGNIWVGTQTSGLNIYNPNTENFIHFSREPDFPFDFDFNHVHVALAGKDGDIWLLSQSSSGIVNFDQATGTFITYLPNRSDSMSWVNRMSTIHEDRTGKLWVGTYKGLFIFDKETRTFLNPESFINIPEELNSSVIKCFFED